MGISPIKKADILLAPPSITEGLLPRALNVVRTTSSAVLGGMGNALDKIETVGLVLKSLDCKNIKIYELKGVPESVARVALRLAASKLPVKTQILVK